MNDEWLASIERFVTSYVPPPPARLLEVGCGEGELALALDRAGYEIVAIDPDAPDGEIFVATTLEDFEDQRGFDAVIGVVVVHHIHHLEAGLDKLGALLGPSGRLLLAEFAWENIDDAAIRWCADRLPPEDDHGWMRSLVEKWRDAGADERAAGTVITEWAEEEIHTYARMRAALDRYFVQRHFEWAPYLVRDLRATMEDEMKAMAAGIIPPVGFRYVGEPRPRSRASETERQTP